MILLDTNVVSEPLRPRPNGRVLDWIDAQAIETLYLSTIAVAELRFGVAMLPGGRRKTGLNTQLEEEMLPLFGDRVLAFDLSSTETFAQLMTDARAKGQAISKTDGYIAAIALAHGLAVATRDTAPFRAAGATVINPWDGDS